MKKLWKCKVCGLVHQGDNAPALCPKCNVDSTNFVELSTEDAQKIYNSDRTNDIHMHLIKDCMKMISLCEEGIKINLDPNCVSTFEKAISELWVIKQRAKAELESHVTKGKW